MNKRGSSKNRERGETGSHWYPFYTQFDELSTSPLLAVLLFGLLRMRVTN
jgi:hypothetical protein